MNHPFWDVGLSYGFLMALVAVVHVYLAHFAIGGGLYLVLAEWFARRSGDEERLGFVRRLSRFFILTTVVMGALTGVGIWFVIGLLNPAATEVLIRNFVWAWAIEWTFFLVEILAAILYWYGWDRLSARRHLQLGWIYFVFAWLSLVVINGIVTFMLTPGAWSETGAFLDGFLNPTYWPSLVFRTGVCVTLAGLFSLLVAAWAGAVVPARQFRFNAIWGLVGLAIALPSLFWYRSVVSGGADADVMARLTIPAKALEVLSWAAVALAVVLVVFGLLQPRLYRRTVAVVVLALGLVWFGSFEWWRESIRKPWAVPGYMYGNGLLAGDVDEFRESGLLAQIRFRSGDDGADLFRMSCRHCHTVDGYNPVAPAFAGTDEAFVQASMRGLHEMRGPMPIFAGSDEEAKILGSWIWQRIDQRPFEEVHPLKGPELGRQVYEVRCGRCHVVGGHNDKSSTLEGADEEFIGELIDAELTPEMPVFTGSEVEREALIRHLISIGKGE